MHHGIHYSTCRTHDSNHTHALDSPVCENATADGGLHSLRDIVRNARFFSGDDVAFKDVATAVEECAEGDLVIYRIGTDCPTAVVSEAMARGAAGILTEQVLPCPLPQCIVGDVELALAEITAERLGRPDRKLLTVGVIGSAGKTITALLISSLMRSSGIRAAYQTDLGHSDGVVQETSTVSMPTRAALVRWIAEAHDGGSNAAVIELNDDVARRGGYEAIQFDVLVVTGSADCSPDYGPSGLQCVLERLASNGVVVSPEGNTRTTQLIRDHGLRSACYGVAKANHRGGGRIADVTAKVIEQSDGMMTMTVTSCDTTAVMETTLCGSAMASNHAAAALVGLLIGQPLEDVVEKLSALRTIPGRCQRLPDLETATVVIDTGGTPERAASALRAQRSMKARGQLWCVLAVDAGDGAEQLASYGNLAERLASHTIVTAKRGAKAGFLFASQAVMDGVRDCAAMRLVADRTRAIEWAVSEARPCDTILVITSERNQTAHEHRLDLERIRQCVEAARNNEPVEPAPTDGPVRLKVVG